MDKQKLTKLTERVLRFVPPKDKRKLQVKLRNVSNSVEFCRVGLVWINRYRKLYIKNYYKLAKVLLLGIDFLNSDTFNQYEQEFMQAVNKNLVEFNKITFHYIERINSKFPIDKLLNSLLIMMVLMRDFEGDPEKISFFELKDQVLGSFIEKLIDQDKERFDIYFFDWNLKYGYLIESYIKEMLCMRLMLKNLIGDKDNSKLFQHTPMMGFIVSELGEEVIQKEIRNAIFHSDFFLEYEANWDKRLITFIDQYGNFYEYSAKKFLSSFFETVQWIFTFDFALEYVHFLRISKGNENVHDKINKDFKNNQDYFIHLFDNFKSSI